MTKLDMELNYGTGDTYGFYAMDDMLLGGAKISKQHFGVSTYSDILEHGIMGLSYSHEEAFVPTILDGLVSWP